MAIVDSEIFADKEVERIYIAGRLREAKRVERTLTENGIQYAVEIELFTTHILGILPVQYNGVAFYVLVEQAEASRDMLTHAGLTKGLM